MNFRALLVSNLGKIIVFVISALVASAVGWTAANAPWLQVEKLVNLVGGQLVVTLLVLGALREGLSWVVAHWAFVNIKAVALIQEALNIQAGADLKTDGLLQRQTGFAINRLMSAVDLPVEKMPEAKKVSDVIKSALSIVLALAIILSPLCLLGCAGDGGAHAKFDIPIPIPPEEPEKQWFIRIDIGLFPPRDFQLFGDAPIKLGLSK